MGDVIKKQLRDNPGAGVAGRKFSGVRKNYDLPNIVAFDEEGLNSLGLDFVKKRKRRQWPIGCAVVYACEKLSLGLGIRNLRNFKSDSTLTL